MIRARWLFFVLLFAHAAQADPGLTAAQVPQLQIRFRVVDATGANRFVLPGDKTFATGTQRDAWSDWLVFGPDQAETALKQAPNVGTKALPLVVRLSVSGPRAPLTVDAELKLADSDSVVPLREDLLGPVFAFALWRDADSTAQADTLAGYNRRTIWKQPAIERSGGASQPRQLPIIDRFIGGSDDIGEWREGTAQLLQHGANTLLFDAPTAVRSTLRGEGLTRISGAVYAPPESPFAFPIKPNAVRSKPTTELLDEWAGKLAKPYRDAGYDPKDLVLYHLADEPGWYYPAVFAALRADAAGMARFHRYLEQHGLRPLDLGAKRWDDVLPIGISQANDLPHRRLFYWTMQFFPWESAQYYAASTAAMERAFRPGLPNPVNWNFFSARSYVPGPVANNADKLDPDAAMGGHDWFEFARLRGSTMLWTEDWFADAQASDWSFQAARLNSAARWGGIAWGAYIVPRTSGETEYGLMQKVLSVVGNGGKAIEYFVFGPEYNFPGNCYSPRAEVILPKMSRVHAMLAKADDLLWPGRKPQAQVAILQPRSSEVWDPIGVSDATNNHLNRFTVDYMAEIYDLYRGLQQLDVPADFVAEDGLTPQQLHGYSVLFATEPNLPREDVDGLLAWVRAGGTLVTVSGALSADRYNDPMSTLQRARGIDESPRMRLWVANADLLPKTATVDDAGSAYGARTALHLDRAAHVLARFEDGAPAIVEHGFGRGRFVHFAFFPGLSAQVARDKTSQRFSDAAKQWIGYPLRAAGVEAPVHVDRDAIETPLLQSPAGATITLLDWREHGGDAAVHVTARLGFAPKSVESVTRGALEFSQQGDATTFALPLHGADIVLLRK